jgi:hypothetical protein
LSSRAFAIADETLTANSLRSSSRVTICYSLLEPWP